jgi:FKBP-type peptidyl-prolyl cis-trans isomerase
MRSHISTGILGFALLLGGCDKAPATDTAKPAAASYDLSAESNARFLADFAAKPGAKKTDDGLEYRVIKAGTGKAPQSGADMVTVQYKGMLINGKVFDQTEPGKTATFPAGRLIPGWIEALSLMREGDHWELAIPSDLGYGPEGAGEDIPGGQTLVFDMTLEKVEPAQ